MLYDISPPISPALAVWPGDTAPSQQTLLKLADGATIDLSTLHATVHLGAHADATSHYHPQGQSIEHRPLEPYLGPCEVMHVKVARNSRIRPGDLPRMPTAPRVLFGTDSYPDPTTFNQDFAALSPELIEMLASRGVMLVGIDTPSIDLFDSKDLPSHHACFRHNVANLEGLVLSKVPAGIYELIALPLSLVGFDASPVRAVLRST